MSDTNAWTVLVHLAGNQNLTGCGFAVTKISAAKPGEHVNTPVQPGRYHPYRIARHCHGGRYQKKICHRNTLSGVYFADCHLRLRGGLSAGAGIGGFPREADQLRVWAKGYLPFAASGFINEIGVRNE